MNHLRSIALDDDVVWGEIIIKDCVLILLEVILFLDAHGLLQYVLNKLFRLKNDLAMLVHDDFARWVVPKDLLLDLFDCGAERTSEPAGAILFIPWIEWMDENWLRLKVQVVGLLHDGCLILISSSLQLDVLMEYLDFVIVEGRLWVLVVWALRLQFILRMLKASDIVEALDRCLTIPSYLVAGTSSKNRKYDIFIWLFDEESSLQAIKEEVRDLDDWLGGVGQVVD